jgi:hypothetical protein
MLKQGSSLVVGEAYNATAAVAANAAMLLLLYNILETPGLEPELSP